MKTKFKKVYVLGRGKPNGMSFCRERINDKDHWDSILGVRFNGDNFKFENGFFHQKPMPTYELRLVRVK